VHIIIIAMDFVEEIDSPRDVDPAASAASSPSYFKSTPLTISGKNSKSIVSLKYSEDGAMLASAAADKKAHIYDTSTGQVKQVLEGAHSLGLNDCAWIGQRYLATASDDKCIKIWDVEAGKAVTTLQGSKSYVYTLAVHPDTQMILSGGTDGIIRMWHAPSRSLVMSMSANAGAVVSLEFSPSGAGGGNGNVHESSRDFASGSHDGMVRVWDAANLSACKSSFHCEYSPPVSCVRYTPNGKYLLVSTLDNKHRLFPSNSDMNRSSLVYEPVREYSGHKNTNYTSQTSFFIGKDSANQASPVSGTRAANSAKFVVSGSDCGSVYAWDIDRGTVEERLTGHSDAVLAVASSPNENAPQIASASRDATINIWKARAAD